MPFFFTRSYGVCVDTERTDIVLGTRSLSKLVSQDHDMGVREQCARSICAASTWKDEVSRMRTFACLHDPLNMI